MIEQLLTMKRTAALCLVGAFCSLNAQAQNMAAMSTKGKVQVQATLVSIKEMAGWTFYGCLLCAGLMLVLPWRKRNIRELTREYLLKNVDVKSLGRR